MVESSIEFEMISSDILIEKIIISRSCNHEFSTIIKQDSQKEMNFICNSCLSFLQIRFEKRQCKNHFYCINDCVATCFHCNQTVNFIIKTPVINKRLITKFLFKKQKSTQNNALLLLSIYLSGAISGSLKPINSENVKFKTFIGIDNPR